MFINPPVGMPPLPPAVAESTVAAPDPVPPIPPTQLSAVPPPLGVNVVVPPVPPVVPLVNDPAVPAAPIA